MVQSVGREVKAMGESEARKEWTKANTVRFGLKLQKSTDADIIEHLRNKDSIQGYIKDLIRKDIEQQKSTKKSGK